VSLVDVVQSDGRTLQFEGELLGHATSRDEPGLQRWNEISIYKTSMGNYVAAQVGKSLVPGEVDRSDGRSSKEPRDIVKFLARRGFLTATAREALQQAGKLDPAIADAMIERV